MFKANKDKKIKHWLHTHVNADLSSFKILLLNVAGLYNIYTVNVSTSTGGNFQLNTELTTFYVLSEWRGQGQLLRAVKVLLVSSLQQPGDRTERSQWVCHGTMTKGVFWSRWACVEREADICIVRCVAQVSREASRLKQSPIVVSGLFNHMVFYCTQRRRGAQVALMFCEHLNSLVLWPKYKCNNVIYSF